MNALSAMFGTGVALRNALYDRGMFKVMRLARPVISVGNISTGGSGKTPFVVALGQRLSERGIAFDILSRGYGRRSTAPSIVDPNGAPDQFGDEPLLMARKLQAPVIVGGDRFAAGLLAEQQFSPQLHLLDDGFQHRRLHRDFDIVIVRADDLRETLLPMGRLREPVSACHRADALLTLDTLDPDPFTFNAKPVWAGRRRVTVPAASGSMIAFCGIGRPEQFFVNLREQGIQVAGTVVFPDHHRYTERDVGRLLRTKSSAKADGFITTEKDLVNLGTLSDRLPRLGCARLDIVLLHPDEVLNTLLSRVVL